MNDRSRASRKSASGSGAPASPGSWLLLLLPVIAVLVLRFWTVGQLESSPLISNPQLQDRIYLAEATNIAAPPLGAAKQLPQGSLLYSQLGAEALDNEGAGNLSLVQIALEGLTTLLLTFWIARRFGLTAGLIAGLLYALDPLGGFFAARWIPTTWTTLVLVAAVITLDAARRSKTPLLSLGFGLLTALGFAFSPLLFLALAVVAVFDQFQNHNQSAAPARSGLGRLGWVGGALLPLVLVGSLLLVRNNDLPEGGPTLSWGSGITVYQSSQLGFGGTPRSLSRPAWKGSSSWQAEAWQSLAREGTLYEFSQHFANKGRRQWLVEPVESIGVLFVKAAGTLGAWPIPDALSPSFLFAETAPLLNYGSFYFALLFGLALAGWWMFRAEPRRGDGASLLLGLVAVALACLIGTTSAASRQPALPLLAAWGGIFLAPLFTRRPANAAPPALSFAALGVGIVLSLAAGYLSPTRALDDPSEEYRLISGALSSEEKWSDALDAAKKSVNLAPENLEARTNLARLYRRDGLNTAAQEQYETIYAADSTHVSTLLALAKFEQGRGDVPKAILYISRLVTVAPNNPLYLNELGQLYLHEQRISAARNIFVRALEIKPDYRVAQANLEAVVRYERNLERQLYADDPILAENDPLNLQIQQVVAWMGAANWTSADSLLRVTEAEHPDHVLPHFMRAGYHSRRGEAEQAVAALELCHRIAPCRLAVAERLAGLYAAHGDPDRALALVDGCLAQMPEADSLFDQWKALRASLAADPDSP